MNSGSKMLQVVSILMIVFGAISTVMVLIGLFGLAVIIEYFGLSGWLYLAYIMLTLGAIAELVVGIIGVVNCKDQSKAPMLLSCGIVIIVLTLLGNILSLIFYSDGFNATTLISGLLFPILFTVGASQMKNAPANPMSPNGPMGYGTPVPPPAPYIPADSNDSADSGNSEQS